MYCRAGWFALCLLLDMGAASDAAKWLSSHETALVNVIMVLECLARS